MSGPLILFIGAIYIVIAGISVYNRNMAQFLIYFGYALGNLGLFFLSK